MAETRAMYSMHASQKDPTVDLAGLLCYDYRAL